MFGDREPLRLPEGQTEFEQAMTRAVSSGENVWITTKAGELFAGEVQGVRGDALGANGREITVTINDRELVYQEVAHWTAGLTGEPDDIVLDATINRTLQLFGPMTVEDLATAIATGPASMWCPVPRAQGRLRVLEHEKWVRRIQLGEAELWEYARA